MCLGQARLDSLAKRIHGWWHPQRPWGELLPAEQLIPLRSWREERPNEVPPLRRFVVLRGTRQVEDRLAGADEPIAVGQAETCPPIERVVEQPLFQSVWPYASF